MSNKTSSDLLSDDMLRSIFVLLAQDPSRNEDDWNWYRIAHVCRQWRIVALDTSAFWSNIICHSTSLQMINMQLSYSKNADLSFTFLQIFYTVDPFHFEEILAAVFAHKERITNMYIKTHDILWYTLKRFISSFPPKLNALHVEIFNRDGPSHFSLLPVPLRDILSLDDLHRLHIANISLQSSSFRTSKMQTLTNLTELTFDNVNVEWRRLRNILRLSPNIQKLAIVFAQRHKDFEPDDNIDQHSNESSRIRLNSLRDLKIHGLSTFQAHWLFQILDLPSSSNLDIKCFAPSSLIFKLENDTLRVHKSLISAIFSRNMHSGALHIALDDNSVLFRTELSPDLEGLEAGDECGRTVSTISFALNHQLINLTYTNDERCAFLTQLIRNSYWRKIRSFRFYFKSRTDEITKDKWVDILDSFNNLSSLEVLLHSSSHQSQAEFSSALAYVGDRDILKSTMHKLSFKLTWYDDLFIQNLKGFLGNVGRKRGNISKLQIEYSTDARRHNAADIQDLKESLSEYAQEVRVDVYRSTKSMCSSD